MSKQTENKESVTTTLSPKFKGMNMSNKEDKPAKKEKRALHLSLDVLERFKTIQDEANQKDFGKRLSLEDVAVAVLDSADRRKVVETLKNDSMRPQDQVEYIYNKYCDEHGKIDFNSFLLKALTGQINVDLDVKALSQAAGQ